jgi:hypothetical protein
MLAAILVNPARAHQFGDVGVSAVVSGFFESSPFQEIPIVARVFPQACRRGEFEAFAGTQTLLNDVGAVRELVGNEVA